MVESATKRRGQEGTTARSQQWLRWSGNGADVDPRGQVQASGPSQPHFHGLYKSKAEKGCDQLEGASRLTLKPLIKLMQDG